MSGIINKLQLIYNRIKKLLLYITKGEWITKTEISVENYIKGKIPGTVRISIGIFILAMIIIGLLTILTKGYKRGFGQGILIESFGMLLDLFVIAIIVLWLNEWRDKKLKLEIEIKRYHEEINDYRHWQSDEAKYRIMGNIRRLNKNGISKIDLSFCYLKGVTLLNTQLMESTLRHVNLQNAHLILFSNLERANCLWADLRRASLFHVNIQGANLMCARFQEADLTGSNLHGANFRYADLQGANLSRANLQGAINLTVEQLSNVKTLYEAKLDSDLMEQIEENYPHLLEQLEEEEPF